MSEPDPLSRAALAESLYARLLLRSPTPDDAEVEALCSSCPDQADELRALHDVQRLLQASDRPMRAASPPSVAGFAVRGLLGRGGMGEVWEAVELSANRPVALKLRPESHLAEGREAERWRREIQAIGRLRHANIVALYSAGESAGRSYIAQELVEGGRTLREEIEELRRVVEVPAQHERRTAERFARLADALEQAHAAGVLHRDVKPQNILLQPDGTPKLADFGLAKLAGDASLSRTGEFVGTYLYASPEQVAGQATPGAQSDVFSLGATLYECLTLERPFSGDSVQSIVQAILSHEPPAPRSIRKSIPAELSVICQKAMEKRPERRYRSAGDLRDDLTRYLSHQPIRARAPTAARRLQKWIRRHPTAASTIGLGGAAFVAILALFLESERRGDDLAQANESLRNNNLELEQTRNAARSEAALSREVEGFLSSMFRAADPAGFGTGEPDLRAVIDNGSARLRAGEVSDPRVRARLLGQLGGLQSRLGDWGAALAMLQESDELWRQIGQGGAPEALRIRMRLAGALCDQGHWREAEALLTPMLARWRGHDGMEPDTAFDMLLLLGSLDLWSGRLGEGQALLEEAEALLGTLPSADPTSRRLLEVELGVAAFLAGRLQEAEEILSENCALLEPVLSAGNVHAVDAFNTLGLVLYSQGRAAEAVELFERVLPIVESKLGSSHPRTLNMRTNLAVSYNGLGRLDLSEPLLLETVDLATAALGERSPEALIALGNLGAVYTAQRRLEEAREVLEVVLERRLEIQGPDHLDTARAQSALGICYYWLGRASEAAELQELALRSVAEDYVERPQMQGALELYRRAAER